MNFSQNIKSASISGSKVKLQTLTEAKSASNMTFNSNSIKTKDTLYLLIVSRVKLKIDVSIKNCRPKAR